MKKILSLLLTIVLVAGLAVGCGKEELKNDASNTENTADSEVVKTDDQSVDEGKKIQIGFAIKTQDSPYFVALVDALYDLTADEGWELSVLDANGDTSKEAQNMETFIAQGVDLIFLDSVDPDACIPSINAAAEAGIGVINLDSGVGAGANDITTVYSDNKQNGREVGLAYAATMMNKDVIAICLSGGKGNVAGKERRTGLFTGIIEGKTGISEAEAWTAALAFDDELISTGKASYLDAGFSVVGQGWGGWNREGGLAVAEDLITANPDLNTVLGENDQMLFGAMTALDNAGIEGVQIVAAADGAKEAYDKIKEGTYFGTGENSPYKISQLGMKIAKEILVDGKDMWSYEDITMTEAVAVTKDNVDQYYDFGF